MRVRFVLVGGVVAGLVLFLWGAIAHVALPWPSGTLHEFTDDATVVEAVRANAPENGIYLSAKGIFASVALKPDGADRVTSFGPFLAAELLANVAAGALLAFLLLHLPGLGAGRLAALAAALGLAAGMSVHASHAIWYGFPVLHTAFSMGELAVGWVLAVLALGALGRRWLGEATARTVS